MGYNLPAVDPVEVMRREMTVALGAVPDSISDPFFNHDGFIISSSEFLFETFDAIRFHYRLGHWIVVQMPDALVHEGRDLHDTDFELFLWGTVFGAVA